MKNYTFKDFKEFLTDKCWDERKYGDGVYDRKIYNWFDLGKPKKIEFLKNKSNNHLTNQPK